MLILLLFLKQHYRTLVQKNPHVKYATHNPTHVGNLERGIGPQCMKVSGPAQ